jgi:diadenylate cyclase
MATVIDFFSKSLNYLTAMRISDMLDILIVAFLIYQAIMLIRRANFLRVTRGVLIVLVALWLSGLLNLIMVNSLLRRAVELGLIALVIIFQPELRRILERMGSGRISDFITYNEGGALSLESAINQTVIACVDMARTRTGALIVFERTTSLNDPMSTGTIIDSDVTAELLRNIFFPKAPLHDGAVIIRNGRVAAAGCMLPLSKNANLSRDLGMRHRAGIGMSEHSDAVAVIVSEETGAISVAVDGMLKRHLSAETFTLILRNELLPEDGEGRKKGFWALIDNFGPRRVRNHDKEQ